MLFFVLYFGALDLFCLFFSPVSPLRFLSLQTKQNKKLEKKKQSCVVLDGFRSLREGCPVEFSLGKTEDGRVKAVDVTGPGGLPPQGAARPLALPPLPLPMPLPLPLPPLPPQQQMPPACPAA